MSDSTTAECCASPGLTRPDVNSTISVHFSFRHHFVPRPTMLRVSKLTDYATAVMTVLADASEPVLSAQDLTERARLELPTVSKLLKQLAHAGLVESFRGVNGGYRLARAPERITIAASHDELAARLAAYCRAGDLVLLKGSRGAAMEQVLRRLTAEAGGERRP